MHRRKSCIILKSAGIINILEIMCRRGESRCQFSVSRQLDRSFPPRRVNRTRQQTKGGPPPPPYSSPSVLHQICLQRKAKPPGGVSGVDRFFCPLALFIALHLYSRGKRARQLQRPHSEPELSGCSSNTGQHARLTERFNEVLGRAVNLYRRWQSPGTLPVRARFHLLLSCSYKKNTANYWVIDQFFC